MSLVVGVCCRGPRCLAIAYAFFGTATGVIGVACAGTAAKTLYDASAILAPVWGPGYGVGIAGVIAIGISAGLFSLECWYTCCCGIALEADIHATKPRKVPAPAAPSVAGGSKASNLGPVAGGGGV